MLHVQRPACVQSGSKAFGKPGARSIAPRSNRILHRTAAADQDAAISATKLSELFSIAPLDPEQQESIQRLARTLDISIGTAKSLAFKKRGLLSKDASEVLASITTISDVVGVPLEQARQMAVIQPGLLFDTQRGAEILSAGIRTICYELKADKEEVVRLILENQSVLHGREMHLSVADIAHLALMREPSGRIVD